MSSIPDFRGKVRQWVQKNYGKIHSSPVRCVSLNSMILQKGRTETHPYNVSEVPAGCLNVSGTLVGKCMTIMCVKWTVKWNMKLIMAHIILRKCNHFKYCKSFTHIDSHSLCVFVLAVVFPVFTGILISPIVAHCLLLAFQPFQCGLSTSGRITWAVPFTSGWIIIIWQQSCSIKNTTTNVKFVFVFNLHKL